MTGAIGRRRPKAPGLILNGKIWQFTGTLEAAMYEDPYELGSAADGYPLRIRARGRSVLSSPMLNRGTAFTPARRALGLIGPRAHRPDGDLTERSVSHSNVYCIFHEAEFRIHITKVTP
jgi:hypothetical protein